STLLVLCHATLRAPAAWAGVVAVIDVALATVTFVAAVPPTVTVAPVAKFVPVIVTFVPPAVDPLVGEIPVTVGGVPYVNPFVRVPLRPLGFVAVTLTAPAACAGVTAVIDVELATVTLVAAVPPIVTVAPVAKFVPVIVTFVPPAVVPAVGEIAVTVGGATYVNPDARVALNPLALVTTTLTAPAAWAGVVAGIEVALATVTLVAAGPSTV